MRGFEQIRERRTDYGISKTFISESGKLYTHEECQRRLKAAVRGTQRWFSRTIRTLTVWNDPDMNEYERERLRWILDDMASYVEIVAGELDRLDGVDRKAARIAALRNVQGRTPEEAALFLAKAEQLAGES